MSDIEYVDEDDEYFDDEWYDNPDDYVMTDRCPLETMADPVFLPDLTQDEDESEFEYESDHFYDDDDELLAPRAKRRRTRGPVPAQPASVNVVNDLSSLSINSQKNLALSKSDSLGKKSTAPVLFARVDPGLTARPPRHYIYEPGHGEVVALLKNWRHIFAESRPSQLKLWRRKGQALKRRLESSDAKRASTPSRSRPSTESGLDLEPQGTPMEGLITPGNVGPGRLRPCLAELGPLELRPTSPPPQSIDYTPLGTAPSEASPRSGAEDESPLTKASPLPSCSPGSSGPNTVESARSDAAEQLQHHSTCHQVLKKRKAEKITPSESSGSGTAEKRPARKQKTSERATAKDELATTIRRSARNQVTD
ncbi:hypothetical protein KEM54_000732 [Ascosphaera aggregata]|nr:hypothetical protein KEM54_000732 [Ascosphaera aggregata]